MTDTAAPHPTSVTGLDRPLVAIVTPQGGPPPEGLVDALLDEAAERGWRLLDLNLTGGSLAGERPPIGAVITVLPDAPLVRDLRQIGCPIVRVGRLPHPDDGAVPAVIPDYAEAGRAAADYFAQRGFRELATVGHEQMEITRYTHAGFADRAAVLGCHNHLHLFTSAESAASKTPADRYDHRARALTDWLGGLPKPIGLLACQDALAGIVSTMCQRAGVAVPEDVAVLSVGNKRAICEMGFVPISAIEFPQEDLGRTAVRLLDTLIASGSAPKQTLVPPRAVVTRRSTDILAVDDPTVARAIRFIWDHLAEPLRVDAVAEAMRVPRYKLERLFRQHLDRGVNAEVRRARLDRFRQLLRTTRQTVDELAPQVGYRSAKRLHVAFRDAYGQTPRRYRIAARAADEHDHQPTHPPTDR